jgi:hypothetical protein
LRISSFSWSIISLRDVRVGPSNDLLKPRTQSHKLIEKAGLPGGPRSSSFPCRPPCEFFDGIHHLHDPLMAKRWRLMMCSQRVARPRPLP